MRVFESSSLLPAAWAAYGVENCYIFNPALICFGGEHLMAYRVVTPDGRRRLAICRLAPDLSVVPHSAVPLSDSIYSGGTWHADPRFCIVQDRLFLHYNNGAQQAESAIYLVEIDPRSLLAVGQARRLVLAGPKRRVEKNWMLFAHGDRLWAVYSIAPHVVLELDLAAEGSAEGGVPCQPVYRTDWDVAGYAGCYGELRGGAPPLLIGDMYVSVFHSLFHVRRIRKLLYRILRKPSRKTLRYVAGAYAFAAAPPFEPIWLHPVPVLTPPPLPRRPGPQLDTRIERSAYPCGSIFKGEEWIVSFGSQEEYCCLATLDGNILAGGMASGAYGAGRGNGANNWLC